MLKELWDSIEKFLGENIGTILSIVFGAIVAILITIFVESRRKPSLELKFDEPSEKEYEDRPAKIKRAIRLKLVNHPLPRWASWMSRNPALQCAGFITFHHLDGQDVFGRKMTIRWTNSDEPIPLTFQFDGKEGIIIDPTRFVLQQRMDVYPGTYELLDVACRYDDEEECYGWNNESYFGNSPWRNPRWKLPKGRYLVKIIVVSSGQKCTGLFRLINDADLSSFRLEKALSEDHKRIQEAEK